MLRIIYLEKGRPGRVVLRNGVKPRGSRIGATQNGVRATATGIGRNGGHELNDGWLDGPATAGGPPADHRQAPGGQRHSCHRLAEVTALP